MREGQREAEMRLTTSARRLARFALLAAALVLGGGAVSAEGVLRIGTNVSVATFDPIRSTANADIWVFNNMNAFLVRANADATGIVPDLAENWEVSDDGLTYTFHLRAAKFSDGSPVTAADVAFSLTRLRDDPQSAWSDPYQIVKAIDTPDERTVVITLSEPAAPFLASLAMFAASILPQKVVEAQGDAFAEHPVGAGAFRLKEWRRDEVVILERNPHYWEEGLPKLDGVEWYKVVDDNTRILKIQAGELDVALFVPFNRLAELEQDPNVDVHLDPSTRADHLAPNHTVEWLSNKNVRKAINMAIDRNAIVKLVTFGYGKPANSFLPAGMLYYNPDNKAYPYDPEQAKALLAQEGAEDLSFVLTHEAGSKVDEQLAIMVQQQLAQVGIDISLRKVDPAQTIPVLIDGDYELSPVYWTNDVIDPDQKTTFSMGGDSNNNFFTRYDNPEAAKLVDQARVETDPDRRRELYYEIQRIAMEDSVMFDLYYSPFRNISRTNVENFYQNPLGRLMLEEVTVE
jgi:peptide/nickel transport system substrate-binding protein